LKRGRPFEPGNKLGRGRPPGSRNKRTLLGQALLEEFGEAVIRRALSLALQGDSPMIRALLPYLLTRPTDPPPKTGPLASQKSGKVRHLVTWEEFLAIGRERREAVTVP